MAQDEDKTKKPLSGETLEGEWQEAVDNAGGDEVDITLPPLDNKPKRRGRGGFFIGLLLLILLAALAAAAFFGWQSGQQLLSQQDQASQQQTQLLGQVNQLTDSLKQLQQQQSKQQNEFSANAKTLSTELNSQQRILQQQQDSITGVQNSLSEWSVRSGTDQTGWQLAEAEWLLWLANMRLQLQQNYNGALTALSQADKLLQQLNKPSLRALRAQLAEEILQLKTAQRPDIDGIALSLLALSNQTDELPLPARPKPDGEIQAAAKTDASSNDSFGNIINGLWQEIRSLVVIRRQEKNLLPWLSDREEQLIYQGLQVRLDAARLAALRGKGSLYQQSVRSAQTWLLTWFDTQSSAVEAVDSELSALAKQQLELTAPDISQSLDLLRLIRQQGAN